MATPRASLLDHPLLEPVLLRSASRRAAALSDVARARMAPWALAAHARYGVALELRDRETQSVAFGLLREAAFFAICALQCRRSSDGPQSLTAHAAWQHFDKQPETEGAPASLARARSALASDEALAFDALPALELNALRPAAEETVAWLLAVAELRTEKQLARARIARVALLALTVAVVVWALVAYWFTLSAFSQHAP